jgi:hypothetical protein
MASSPRKLFVEAFSLGFLTQNTKERVWHLRAHQGKEEGMRNERKGGLFIEKVHHQLFDRVADVQQP